MNLENESQLGAHAIMWAVMNIPEQVEELLMRNGIQVSGALLQDTVVTALKNSTPFRADFLELTSQYPEWSISYMATMDTMDDYANAGGRVADTSLNLTTAINAGATNTGTPKKSWFTADNIQGTLNTALNAFLTIDKNKTDRDLAKASEKVAMYNSQTGGGTTGGGMPPQKSNTTLFVILGVVGLALVGGIVYMATKKP
jgi:hypothetical protein